MKKSICSHYPRWDTGPKERGAAAVLGKAAPNAFCGERLNPWGWSDASYTRSLLLAMGFVAGQALCGMQERGIGDLGDES